MKNSDSVNITQIFVIVVGIILAIAISITVPVSARGDNSNPAYYWNEQMQAYEFDEPRFGIVICTKMNVRVKANTSSKAYGQIKNGQPVRILGVTQKGDFYVLDLDSCGIRSDDIYGYAKTGLIKMDPEFIYVNKLTNLYSTPWETDRNTVWYQKQKHKNGEQNGRYFLVIEQKDDWYAVQAAESSPGTAFIRMRDVDANSPEYYSNEMYVTTWDAPLLDEYTWSQKQVVKRFTQCEFLSEHGDYLLVSFNPGTANEYRGYIKKLYLAPILGLETYG